MNNHTAVPVGVLGASGYVGQELLRLLARHPGASVAFATAESAAGELLEGHRLIKIDDAPLARAEIVLSCLPHGVSARYVHETRAAGRRAVDLSADFRLSTEAVYGLTEVTRPRVAAAELVANPGCYPTAALLALIPLAQRGLIDTSREVVIDAASGVTGAGRNPKREFLFGEVAEDFRAYAVGNEHRHLPELQATLAREAGYAGEPFILVTKGGLPSLKDVVYRNRVAIGVTPVHNVRRPRLTVIAAIDNLVKGAAGQAMQNMNLMLGFEETLGLPC